MKPKHFTLSGKPVELKPETSPKFVVRPGGWILTTENGRQVRLRATLYRGQYSAYVGGRVFTGALVEKSARAGAEDAAKGADLVAQFPGKVRKVLVKAGQTVKEGEKLILVEAMKMEFAIQAPADGTVKSVLVTDGQQLTPGTRFVDFEPKEGGNSKGGSVGKK